jgi:16S rRNA (guanine1516-N2)-methyltransferase
VGGAVFAEFVNGPLGFRRRQGGRASDPLVRAVLGSRPAAVRTVLDATAGLGRDAVLLACAGLRVTACERSRTVAALLADGLRRAHAADPELAAILESRLCIIVDSAERHLGRLGADERPDVIYLDPMHPPRRKAALVRKELRALRYLLSDGEGDEQDDPQLLQQSLAAARQRVVVKRPRHAAPLPGPTPPHQLPGKRVRFDIYPAEHGRFAAP